MVTPEMISAVRMEVGDLSVELPFLTDDVYTYFLTKNNENIRRSSLDAARVILLNLSINSNDRTVDVLSIKNSKAAEAYREALRLFVTNPNLNSMYAYLTAYGSGIDRNEMLTNVADKKINAVVPPVTYYGDNKKEGDYNPFMI